MPSLDSSNPASGNQAEKSGAAGFLIGLMVIAVIGLVWLGYSHKAIEDDVKARLTLGVQSAAAAINLEDLNKLTFTSADANKEGYLRLRERFVNLGSVLRNSHIRGVYAMRVSEQSIRFVADSAPADDPWHSETGVVYAAPPPGIRRVIQTGMPEFVGPYTDEYGSFYSIFVPTKDLDGRPTAIVVGGDVDVAQFDQMVASQQRSRYLWIIIAAFGYYILYMNVIPRMARVGE